MTSAYDATATMNRMYRRQRHIYDLTRRPYLLGRDELIERLQPGATDHVLELGCGTGRNLVVAARRYPGTCFYGVDASTEMLVSATTAVSAAGLSQRVRLAHADALDLDPELAFGVKAFDRIFISYALSMIPRWQATLDVALSMLASSGELHIVDFGAQEGLPMIVRSALRWWLARFDVAPCDRLEAELQLQIRRSHSTLIVERPYRGYVQYAVVGRP